MSSALVIEKRILYNVYSNGSRNIKKRGGAPQKEGRGWSYSRNSKHFQPFWVSNLEFG
jgi:hypothetical protein